MQASRYYGIKLKRPELRIAIVTALFNEKITLALESAARLTLKNLGAKNIISVHVPGAWELPFATDYMFRRDLADAAIACGCVVRGETGHYEIVARESAAGLQAVALRHGRPVLNAVLAVENWEQAQARSGDNADNKGAEAARALVELVNNLEGLI